MNIIFNEMLLIRIAWYLINLEKLENEMIKMRSVRAKNGIFFK